MLRRGRVDAIIGSTLGLRYGMEQLAMDTNNLEHALFIGHKAWWLHLSKNTDLASKITTLQGAADKLFTPDLMMSTYRRQLAAGCY